MFNRWRRRDSLIPGDGLLWSGCLSLWMASGLVSRKLLFEFTSITGWLKVIWQNGKLFGWPRPVAFKWNRPNISKPIDAISIPCEKKSICRKTLTVPYRAQKFLFSSGIGSSCVSVREAMYHSGRWTTFDTTLCKVSPELYSMVAESLKPNSQSYQNHQLALTKSVSVPLEIEIKSALF